MLVGFHPYFIMSAGMPTHFDGADGDPVAVETYVHLHSEHVAAAKAVDLVATELHEGLIDDEWIRRKPKWEAYRRLAHQLRVGVVAPRKRRPSRRA